jgi:hypothetical protein
MAERRARARKIQSDLVHGRHIRRDLRCAFDRNLVRMSDMSTVNLSERDRLAKVAASWVDEARNLTAEQLKRCVEKWEEHVFYDQELLEGYRRLLKEKFPEK